MDESAPSFCFYPNPKSTPQMIEPEVLKKVVFFAQKNNLVLHLLANPSDIPQTHSDIIDEISHLYITTLPIRTQDDILIIEITDVHDLPVISNVHNIILRIDKNCLNGLPDIVAHFVNVTHRINVHLLDVDLFGQEEFEVYQKQLHHLSKIYEKTDDKELNILTDRMFLSEMNNCNAGIGHITVAPNGKFYICPAFYYDDQENFIGSVYDDLFIENNHLYKTDYAPLCRACDAFHCRRCVWLNQKTTGEVNTPSHEQCVISHIERNTSGLLLQNNSGNREWIPEIDYLDPIEKFK